jgi:uncharacterized protein
VLLCGSCLQGLTGFGYSLFSLPLLVLLMPAQTAVPMLAATSIFLNLMVFIRARRNVNLLRILPLLLSGAAGIPAGIMLLKSADESILRIVIGALVTISSAIYLGGFRVRVQRERMVMVPVGLLSGILNGATTFSGPPVILFFANQGVAKHEFRGSLAAYFLLLNVITVPAFVAGGLFSTGVALGTAYLFPAVAAGSMLGIWLSDRVSQVLFRRLALAALALLGVISIFSGL